MTKDGRTGGSGNGDASRRRRVIYLCAAMAICFMLQVVLATEYINLAKLRRTILRFPTRWQQSKSSSDFSFHKKERPLLLWEQPTLLNLNFAWVVNNISICQLDNDSKGTMLMPILVHTGRYNFRERLAIRKSYGSIKLYKNWTVRLVFLLGLIDRVYYQSTTLKLFHEMESNLEKEILKFGDIVMGNFTDSYHNLTYKHMMGYKWILNFCPEADFVLKVDDDMFIDIMNWIDWRTAELQLKKSNSSAILTDLYCDVRSGSAPYRGKSDKWYASKKDWPDPTYPDYCQGWAYGITVNLIRKLYSVSQMVKFFWVDDVFVTGVLIKPAEKIYNYTTAKKILWSHVTYNMNEYRPLCINQTWEETRRFKQVVSVPRTELFERDMVCMWNKTLHDKRKLVVTTTPVPKS